MWLQGLSSCSKTCMLDSPYSLSPRLCNMQSLLHFRYFWSSLWCWSWCSCSNFRCKCIFICRQRQQSFLWSLACHSVLIQEEECSNNNTNSHSSSNRSTTNGTIPSISGRIWCGSFHVWLWFHSKDICLSSWVTLGKSQSLHTIIRINTCIQWSCIVITIHVKKEVYKP